MHTRNEIQASKSERERERVIVKRTDNDTFPVG